MKKASISILLILICYLGYGQTYPLQQNVGNTPTTKVKTNALEGKIIITAFTDTSAANSEGYLKNYDGAVIKTTTPINALWYRVLDSAKWVQILPTGGGTGGIRAWLDGGNYNVLADGQGNAVFGTLGKNGIKFTTQAIPRFILDTAGILSETGSTIGIGYDPSNGNRLTQYSGGGGGGGIIVSDSAWSLTGNSGTTAGTNYIGTNDFQDLIFKTNSTFSGRVGLANTSFGLASNEGGSGNAAFGAFALGSNSTGIFNTAIGQNSLASIDGSANIGLGFYAGGYSSGSNKLFINSINRVDEEGDTTLSIIYGAQDATASNQRLYLNSQVYAPYLSTGVGTKAVRYDGATGQFLIADTTSGDGGSGVTSVSGTTNRITSTGGTTPVIDISSNYDTAVSGKIRDSIDANAAYFRNPELGDTLLTNPSTNEFLVKSLIAGTGVTLTPTDSTITIDANSGGSDTLTKGSTPTSGFTNGDVLFNNAGTLDGHPVSGSGNVALTTSPLFTTPRLNSTSTTGYVWTATDVSGNGSFQASTGGTVTSVGLTMPGTLFDAVVPGSPVTSTGTLAPTIKNQIAYGIFGNNTGSSATPTFFTNPYKDSIKITSNSYQDSIWARTNGTFVLQYVRSRLNTPGQLTDGATITWDCKITLNDSVTLAGNRTLAMSNAVAGMYGTLLVKQDATGSRTLTLPANSKVINGGAGAIVLTATAAAKDILSFYFDGTYYYWTYGKNYN